MPRTGVSVLRNEPEFLDEWVEKVARDHVRPSDEERLIRRQHATTDDASAAVRARSGAAFRERNATSARAPSAPPPVGAPRTEVRALPVRAPRTEDDAPSIRAPRSPDRPRAVRTPAPQPPGRAPASPAPRRTPAPPPPRPAPRAHEEPPERRTVTIRGQVADRYNPTQRRRPDVRRHERPGFRPDRVAMWAVLLGFILVLVAATSAHAAILVR